MKKRTAKMNIAAIASIGVLSAIAYVLQFMEISIPIMPFFIKFDFSDLPALIGSMVVGPIGGVLIALIKNLLHLTVTQSGGVGELSNFILNAIFVIPAGILYKKKKTRKSAITGAILGAILMAVISFPANLFVVYPVYYNFMPQETILSIYQAILPFVQSIPQCLLVFNVPFTFVKALISVIIIALIYKPLAPILRLNGNVKE